jgi:hypothetical protein
MFDLPFYLWIGETSCQNASGSARYDGLTASDIYAICKPAASNHAYSLNMVLLYFGIDRFKRESLVIKQKISRFADIPNI